MNWKEMDETPRRYGVWMNKKNGKLAMAIPSEDPKCDWEIDKGLVKPHPLFRIKQTIVAQGTGNFFFNKHLRGYELIDEQVNVTRPMDIIEMFNDVANGRD